MKINQGCFFFHNNKTSANRDWGSTAVSSCPRTFYNLRKSWEQSVLNLVHRVSNKSSHSTNWDLHNVQYLIKVEVVLEEQFEFLLLRQPFHSHFNIARRHIWLWVHWSSNLKIKSTSNVCSFLCFAYCSRSSAPHHRSNFSIYLTVYLSVLTHKKPQRHKHHLLFKSCGKFLIIDF